MARKRDFEALEQRRLQALSLLNEGLSQATVARELQVSRQSVMRWNRARLEGGKSALKAAGRAGRKPRMSTEQDRRLAAILTEGPEKAGFSTPLWTLERVAQLIRREFGIVCHPTTALRILRKRLRWSCQKPVGRALERDEVAIQHWKKKTWPMIKKKPSGKAGPLSSSMKAG